MVTALHNAAPKVFKSSAKKARTPWITEETLYKLWTKLPRPKRKRITTPSTCATRQNDWLARTESIGCTNNLKQTHMQAITKGVWNAVRNQKKGFGGVRRHLVVKGKPVPWTKTHIAIRDHLQDVQWAQRPLEDPQNPRPQLFDTHPEDHNFTIEELQTALQKLRKDKAPGPDEHQNEVIMLLDDYGELQIFDLFNEASNSGEVPEPWLQAKVISIYKGK